jgi:putative ABC transport system ATP-binding protein
MITHQLKLATEPTGNLDEIITADIIDTLRQVAHENDKCVIVVTHSKQLAKE